jgi:hypothetical protein
MGREIEAVGETDKAKARVNDFQKRVTSAYLPGKRWRSSSSLSRCGLQSTKPYPVCGFYTATGVASAPRLCSLKRDNSRINTDVVSCALDITTDSGCCARNWLTLSNTNWTSGATPLTLVTFSPSYLLSYVPTPLTQYRLFLKQRYVWPMRPVCNCSWMCMGWS